MKWKKLEIALIALMILYTAGFWTFKTLSHHPYSLATPITLSRVWLREKVGLDITLINEVFRAELATVKSRRRLPWRWTLGGNVIPLTTPLLILPKRLSRLVLCMKGEGNSPARPRNLAGALYQRPRSEFGYAAVKNDYLAGARAAGFGLASG